MTYRQSRDDNATGVRIFLVAGEASGDALAAALVAPLTKHFGQNTRFAGIGGPAMARAGIESPVDINSLSVLGYVEGLRAWPRVRRLARQSARHAHDFGADIVVLVDSWGFTLRVAHHIRKLSPNALLIKYVGPQIWASRPGRAKTLAGAVDHLLTIHAFDESLFNAAGLPTQFVGNPAFSVTVKGDGARLRADYDIAENAPVLLVLFGSRASEFDRLHEDFLHAIGRLQRANPDLVVMTLASQALAKDIHAIADNEALARPLIVIEGGRKYDVFAASDFALACSGTVTSELAVAGTPMVIAYKVAPVTWWLLTRFFLRTRFVSLINIALDRGAVPEYLQDKCTAAQLSEGLSRLMQDKAEQEKQKEDLAAAVRALGAKSTDASDNAAQAIYQIWRGREGKA